MNRNKLVMITTSVLLVGCSSQQTTSNTDNTVQLTTPISQTDFSQDKAENVFNMAVRNHCKLEKQVCTVKKVVMQGDSIYGTYTYKEEEQEYTVTATLENVQVSNNDSSIVTIGRKEFSTGIIQQKEETNDTSDTEEGNTNTLDLPSEVGDHQSEDVLLDDGVYKVRLMNLTSGSMNFSGTFEGTGTFDLYVLTLDQSQRYDIAHIDANGSYNETVSLEAGWYYIVIERVDGTYTMYWQGM